MAEIIHRQGCDSSGVGGDYDDFLSTTLYGAGGPDLGAGDVTGTGSDAGTGAGCGFSNFSYRGSGAGYGRSHGNAYFSGMG